MVHESTINQRVKTSLPDGIFAALTRASGPPTRRRQLDAVRQVDEGQIAQPRSSAGSRCFFLATSQQFVANLGGDDNLAKEGTGAHMPRVLFIDKIQYLADWERHLKAFVDAHPDVRCVASGSAAAALRLKSVESGAGRFTDFLLPPLTFYEYLDLQDRGALVEYTPEGTVEIAHGNVAELNRHFIDYINFGGYPEAALSSTVQSDIGRIQDVQELNALFTTGRAPRPRWNARR